jgi:thiamine biosynthesis protein ThiC
VGEGMRAWASKALTTKPAVLATKEGGAQTSRTQRQGAQVLIDGPGHRVREREVVSHDLGRASRSDWGDQSREGW